MRKPSHRAEQAFNRNYVAERNGYVAGTKVMRDNAITQFEIAKLELQDGDTLVVRTDLMLTRDQSERLRERVAACVPAGTPVMVLSAGVSLQIVRDAQADAS